MVEVVVGDEAQAEIDSLPMTIRARLWDVLGRLERWPEVSGAKWLTGDWKGHARVRTGDYRVIFHLEGEDRLVVVGLLTAKTCMPTEERW